MELALELCVLAQEQFGDPDVGESKGEYGLAQFEKLSFCASH